MFNVQGKMMVVFLAVMAVVVVLLVLLLAVVVVFLVLLLAMVKVGRVDDHVIRVRSETNAPISVLSTRKC